MSALASVLWPLLLGWGLLRWAGVPRRGDPAAWWAWAWCAGALGTALVVFVWLWTPLPISGVVPAVAALALLVAGSAWRLAPEPEAPALDAPPHSADRRLYRVALTAVLALLAHRIVVSSTVGVSLGDELYLWAHKAKLLFLAGGFGEEFRTLAETPRTRLFHPDYPLLNPLLQVWAYANAGEITNFANRLPIQGFAVALCALLTSSLRRAGGSLLAAALMLVLLALPTVDTLIRTAHADWMVAAGLVVALDAYLRARATGEDAWNRVLALGLAVMVWSKNEALLLVVGLALAALVAAPPRRLLERLRACWAWLLLPLGLVVLTRAVNAHFDFENDLVTGESAGKPFFLLALDRLDTHLAIVLGYFGREVLLGAELTGHLLLALVVGALAFRREAARPPLRAGLVLFAVFLAGLVVVYLGTPKGSAQEAAGTVEVGAGVVWHMENSAPRLLAQIAPALALWLAALAGEVRATTRRANPGA